MTNEVSVKPKQTIAALAHDETFANHLQELLGKRAPQFITSVLTLANSNVDLNQCDPKEVFSTCLKSASLDLPLDQNLGFAYVLPYKNYQTGKVTPQFQMGYKGFVQLAMRSGEYETIGVREVYENEFQGYDEFTGEEIIKFLPKVERGEKIIGYVAYFITLKGFRKRLYMSQEDLDAHGAKYSKSYNKNNGIWKTEPDAMKKKTVLKLLLSRWGILSTQLQQAITDDQADSDGNYIDRKPTIEITDAEMGESEEERKNVAQK